MKKAMHIAVPRELPKIYSELVALHVPRPIRDKICYENAVEIIDALAGLNLNRDQEDYLDILSQLVETYEDENVKELKTLTGVDLLKALLEENDMTGEDLADLIGVDRSTAYKILKKTRGLTAEHIKKIADRFSISADALLA